MEDYVGVKFKSKLKKKGVKHAATKDIVAAGKCLEREGLVFGNAGNISSKIKGGLIVTTSGSNLNELTADDFAKVTNCDLKQRIVFAEGKSDPSSESILHYLIYKSNPNASAIVHAHSGAFLNDSKAISSGFLLTDTFLEYGTLELAYDTVKTLNGGNFIIMRGHGAVAIGKTVEDATALMIRNYRILKGLSVRVTDKPVAKAVRSVDSELNIPIPPEQKDEIRGVIVPSAETPDINIERDLGEEEAEEEIEAESDTTMLNPWTGEEFEEVDTKELNEIKAKQKKVTDTGYEDEPKVAGRGISMEMISLKLPKLKVKLPGFGSAVVCPSCGTKKRFWQKSCGNCGYFFGIDKISFNSANFVRIDRPGAKPSPKAKGKGKK